MIIACPACQTRYVVPDSAIGVDGRTVRCAKCRHSWFQDGPRLDTPPISAMAPPAPETAPPSVAEPEPPASPPVASPPPASPPPPPVPPVAEPVADDAPGDAELEAEPDPPEFARRQDIEPAEEAEEDEYSQFEHEPPFRGRRNWLKLWTIAAAIFAVVALSIVAAVSYWGLPDWVPVSRPTFAQAQPDLVLDFPPDKQDRRTLPNGTEFFGASGTVTNLGSSTHSVPPILIVLRDARERIVYSWEVRPPKPTLAPGESVSINEAVTDVPRSAEFADFGWKPG